jgi:DNA polymerase V
MAFPSPAQDYKEKTLSIDEFLIAHPNSTFFFDVVNDAMFGDNIIEKHKVVVDKSLLPINGSIIIAALNGEFYIRRMFQGEGQLKLVSSNTKYPPIFIGPNDDFAVWGVVIGSFRRHI